MLGVRKKHLVKSDHKEYMQNFNEIQPMNTTRNRSRARCTLFFCKISKLCLFIGSARTVLPQSIKKSPKVELKLSKITHHTIFLSLGSITSFRLEY